MLFIKLIRRLVPSVALSCLAVGAPVAMADATDELAERFAAVEKAVNGNDAEAWADIMYADDAIVVGEGSEKVVKSREDLMPVLESIVQGSESCSISMNEAQVSNDQAWSFASWSCQPVEGDPFQVRALYVWEKKDAGWLVTAEMYGFGAMQ